MVYQTQLDQLYYYKGERQMVARGQQWQWRVWVRMKMEYRSSRHSTRKIQNSF